MKDVKQAMMIEHRTQNGFLPVQEITKSGKQELLGRVFPELTLPDLAILAYAAVPLQLPPGVEICHQGESGDTVFVIGTGEVEILLHVPDGDDLVANVLTGPSYFGELALLGETVRTATIRTRTPCKLLEISHGAFLRAAEANPNLMRRMMRQIISHLRQSDRTIIAELNQKNSELRHAYANLAEQESLRRQFLTTISHELRTPLTSIQGFLGLLNQGALQGNSYQVAMESITRNVKTMTMLANQMFLLYELYPETPTHAELVLSDLIIDALDIVRETIDIGETEVLLHLAPELPPILGDKRTLRLAIRALIENAIKYNPEHAPVQIHTYRHGDEIAIAVQDAGIGIPNDQLDRIFEPFYRLEQEGGRHLFPGIGAGLTIAKLAVNKHHGRIDVTSQPGVGSVFTIYLPLSLSFA